MLAGRRPEDIAQRLSQAREAGFSLCQLNLMQTGFTRADLIAIAEALDEYGVRPVTIGCYLNPLRPDDTHFMGVCREDLNTLLHSLEIVGARRVVMFSGSYGESLYDVNEQNASEEALAALRGFLSDVVRNTRARNYYLVLEPWRSHVLYTPQRCNALFRSLDPVTQLRVRFVLDGVSFLTHESYPDRNGRVETVCRLLGEHAGVIHLRDCVMPPDGEEMMPGPGMGTLDYPAYLQAIFEHAAPDAPAIVRNIPPAEYASVRDYLLRSSDRWELA
jgi:sugar phosphate isomerase/epimerase